MNGFREAVQDRIGSLVERVGELKQKQYPTPASKLLLEMVNSILVQIPKQLDSYDPRFAQLPGAAGQRASGRLTHLLSHLHEFMFILNETSRAKTPAALISSLRDTVRTQTGSDVELLIRPDRQGLRYRYRPLDKHILEWLTEAAEFIDVSVEDLAAPLGDGVVVLSYPAAERNNVILHCIFLHELGHHITDRNGVLDRVLAVVALPELDGEDPNAFGKVCENWIWEFAADLAAVRLAGPAYAFGIYQSMLATEVLDTHTLTHPASWWRMRVLLDVLRAEGFFEEGRVPPEVLARMESWTGDLASAEERSRAKIQGKVEWEALIAYATEAIPHLIREVDASMPHGFTAADYERECPKLSAQLRQLIPINEWYEDGAWHVASFAGILNTGWNFVLGELEEFYGEYKVTDAREREQLRQRVFALVAKSVEFAQLQKDAAAARRRAGLEVVEEAST